MCYVIRLAALYLVAVFHLVTAGPDMPSSRHQQSPSEQDCDKDSDPDVILTHVLAQNTCAPLHLYL